MLLELCLYMTLHDDQGGGFNQMPLALCFGARGPMLSYDCRMTLHEERGV